VGRMGGEAIVNPLRKVDDFHNNLLFNFAE